MSEWKEISNGCEFVSGYAFKGSDFNDDYKGVPVIKIKNIQNDFVTLGASQYIEDDILKRNYKSVEKFYVQDNEILISMTGAGSVGRVGLTSIDNLALLNQRVGKFVPDEKNLNKEYLYHILTSEYFQRLLFNKGQGSGQPNLSPDEILEVEIPWPSYEEQVVIGSALHNLNRKITLLRQQNQTLEELAQALFKRWFVEFEFPDENGRPYKSSGGKMVESELGEIPEGWRIKTINDLNLYITDLVANGSFATIKENVETKDEVDYALFVRNTDLKNEFINKVFVPEHSYNFLKKTRLYGGEIILANVGDVGTAHMCPYFDIPMTLGNNCIMVRSKVFQNWLYTFFRSRSGFHSLKSAVVGSVQEKLSKTNFKNIELVVPDNNTLKSFESYAGKIYIKIFSNKKEIQTLTQLRDTLLPKLMSGEVRVKV